MKINDNDLKEVKGLIKMHTIIQIRLHKSERDVKNSISRLIKLAGILLYQLLQYYIFNYQRAEQILSLLFRVLFSYFLFEDQVHQQLDSFDHNNFKMEKNSSNNIKHFRRNIMESTNSTFYSSQRSHRQYFSLRKNFSTYSQTTYTNQTPSPNKVSRIKNTSLSPDRKSTYWQNWLLPQGVRKQNSFDVPTISASSVCMMFADNNQVFHSENSQTIKQVASLTKIMTAFTVITICNTYGVKIRQTWIKIQKQALLIEGTTANLRNDDELLVIDLLYGLLLPSGNDAGYALAQYFGKFLSFVFANQNYHRTGEQQEDISKFEAQKQFYDSQYHDQSIKLFVFEMNKNAHKIGLKKTNFSNPTGLTDPNNYSTAYDMGLLVSYCLKNHLMRSIFKKKAYICEAKNQKMANSRQIQWKNTNKHLFQFRDCIGIKTGITPGAGPCLSTAYRIMGRELIVILLNSKSLEDRYIDSQKLYKYARNILQQEQHEPQNI